LPNPRQAPPQGGPGCGLVVGRLQPASIPVVYPFSVSRARMFVFIIDADAQVALLPCSAAGLYPAPVWPSDTVTPVLSGHTQKARNRRPMRMSHLFGRTLREAPGDVELLSNQLMVRAAMIRPLGAGIFSLLPLGWRVVRKIEQIIREEMDAIGGQEMMMP